MPVSVLYCEGGPKSVDVRVLRRLLAGLGGFAVRSVGGKHQLPGFLRWARRELPIGPSVFGLRDRDFDDDSLLDPLDRPRRWEIQADAQTVHVGWTWARNCLENYLLDPVVARRALSGRILSGYEQALQAAAGSLAAYTAARYALALSRPGFVRLESAWGQPQSPDDNLLPAARTETDCRLMINQLVQRYRVHGLPDQADVLQRFDVLLPTCVAGGARSDSYLCYFSGKDLLSALGPALSQFGYASAGAFRAAVVQGIENSADDVWTWLPEWMALRQLVRNA